MWKLILTLVVALLVGAPAASAAVTTSQGGYANTIVYCHAYENFVGTNTEMTDESDFEIQPVGWVTYLERWNGREWYVYQSHQATLPDGGSAYYPYAFRAQGGFDYRVRVVYGWMQTPPTPNVFGAETVLAYNQYGNTFPTRNGHYTRYHYCSV
jgi:hypothetical protein